LHLFPYKTVAQPLRTPTTDEIAILADSDEACREIEGHILAAEQELEMLHALRSLTLSSFRRERGQVSNDNGLAPVASLDPAKP
jgi:hypothetical protein